jgi:hypothetical protein
VPRFTVTISEPELERLIDLAQRERRDPREQAAMLIVNGLALEAAALPTAPTRQPDRLQEREAPG